MTAQFAINPYVQSNFAGTFFVSSEGYTQGDLQDDAATFSSYLARGVVSGSASAPMWGGLAINAAPIFGAPGVGVVTPSPDLGTVLTAAATLANITGFTTLTRSTALLVSAQSRSPIAPAGGAINFVRLGTRARIAVGVSAAAVTAWTTTPNENSAVYWDTVNLVITNAAGTGIVGPIPGVLLVALNANNSRVVSYNSGTGFANWSENGACAVIQI